MKNWLWLVARFLTDAIDSSGGYRRKKKKTRADRAVNKKVFSAFGTSSKRNLMVTKDPINEEFPGVGVYSLDKPKKNFKFHSFGGDIKFEPAFEIVCAPINLDTKCEKCEEMPKNVYWKNKKTLTVLCRSCYNKKVLDIKKKPSGIIEKLRQLEAVENDFEKKRYCDFYHEHNQTSAAIRLLAPKTFHQRIHKENFLNTLFKY